MVFTTSLPHIELGQLLPPEDSFKYRGNVFAVADGITRDPGGTVNWLGKDRKKLLKKYPNPSGARWAADLFCQTILREHPQTLSALKQTFVLANRAIARLNHRHIEQVDYLINDFFACTAAAVIKRGATLHWGVIGDCGVTVFDRHGKQKFITPDSVATFRKFINRSPQGDNRWAMPERRVLIRQQFRNNPQQIRNDHLVAYGALTGEPNAEPFMYFGSHKVAKGDLVVVYSDGFFDLLNLKTPPKLLADLNTPQSFLDYDLKLARRNPDKYGHERTLISFLA